VPTCPRCAATLDRTARTCPSCGLALTPDEAPTVMAAVPSAGSPASRTPGASSSGGSDPERFAPGAILGDRYRILGRLGRGGMGEVYRADDLRLGQAVALKFLPPGIERDPARLAQFHAEIRLARHVSHPNVCRVYDIGEAGGAPFFTMEYVDGEDLASLLRRIGHLPQDKGLEVARQLCAGLAAVHDRGVLHRDLKPANVMIDGEGHVRLTDFGLAALAETARGAHGGTPAYMAPELRAGGEPSVRGDLYALGLVLYELFTGRRAYEVPTPADAARSRPPTEVTPPTAIVAHLDPAIERAVLRCLAHDPAQRPRSALAVAAALPGGDPLAAALAAGETPSPELVAAAGAAAALPPARAIATVAALLLALLLTTMMLGTQQLTGRAPLPRPPAVLEDRSQQLVAALGYGTGTAHTWARFEVDGDYLRYLREGGPAEWGTAPHAGTPSGLLFAYRTSPRTLVPYGHTSDVTVGNPPLIVSGMTLVLLDPDGRLRAFHGVPRQVDHEGGQSFGRPASRATRTAVPSVGRSAGPPSALPLGRETRTDDPSISRVVDRPVAAPPAAVDWGPLFAAAQLDPSRLAPAVPAWTPRVYADVRTAWTGEWPGRSGVPLRVEAAAAHGRPVYFELVGPWSRPARDEEARPTPGERFTTGVVTVAMLGLILACLLVARMNLRAGRGDRAGATRLALVVFLTQMVAWLLTATHVAKPDVELERFFVAIGMLLFYVALAWVLYVALEPWVRRFWPDSLMGWTRLFSGAVRDPRVGRDLLAGAAVGIAVQLAFALLRPLQMWLGHDLPAVSPANIDFFRGPHMVIGLGLQFAFGAAFNAMVCIFTIVGLKVLLGRVWLAWLGTVLFYVVLTVPSFLASPGARWLNVLGAVIIVAAMPTVAIRFGLLAAVCAFFFSYVLSAVPWSWTPSAWTFGQSALTVALLAGLLAFAGWAASRTGDRRPRAAA